MTAPLSNLSELLDNVAGPVRLGFEPVKRSRGANFSPGLPRPFGRRAVTIRSMSPANVQSHQENAPAGASSDGAATLAEIARAAGVSAPTVSKGLNGRADVAPATRTKVEELLLQHGYRRRRGSTTQSQLIDLVFHELDSAWAMEVVRGVEN